MIPLHSTQYCLTGRRCSLTLYTILSTAMNRHPYTLHNTVHPTGRIPLHSTQYCLCEVEKPLHSTQYCLGQIARALTLYTILSVEYQRHPYTLHNTVLERANRPYTLHNTVVAAQRRPLHSTQYCLADYCNSLTLYTILSYSRRACPYTLHNTVSHGEEVPLHSTQYCPSLDGVTLTLYTILSNTTIIY